MIVLQSFEDRTRICVLDIAQNTLEKVNGQCDREPVGVFDLLPDGRFFAFYRTHSGIEWFHCSGGGWKTSDEEIAVEYRRILGYERFRFLVGGRETFKWSQFKPANLLRPLEDPTYDKLDDAGYYFFENMYGIWQRSR